MNKVIRKVFSVGMMGLLVLIAIFGQTVRADGPQMETLALTNGIIIDGNGGAPVPNGIVIMEDGIITAVGPYGQVQVEPDVRVIDLKGAFVLPGFINAHVHDAFDEKKLEAWAQDGVTTVRDMANDGPLTEIFAFRDRVLQNPRMARLVAAGPMVTVEDGYPMAFWGGGGVIVDSPEDARNETNRLIDAGADLIKIPLEPGGIFGMFGLNSWPTLTIEQARAIVETAHRRGLRVSCHVTTYPMLKMALEAGVDDIAHMVIDEVREEKIFTLMVNKNVYWVPTLELMSGLRQPGTMGVIYQNLNKFNAAGGKVALGTDFAGARMRFELGMPIIEMDQMQKVGMTPMQIIVAATKNAAYVCNREKSLGTLEKGKIADILVISEDPLKDIHAMKSIQYVIKSGVIIRQTK